MNRHARRAQGDKSPAQEPLVIKDTYLRMLVICIRGALYGTFDPKRWPAP